MKRYLVAYRYGSMGGSVNTVVMKMEGPPRSQDEVEALTRKMTEHVPGMFPGCSAQVIGWSELGPEPGEA